MREHKSSSLPTLFKKLNTTLTNKNAEDRGQHNSYPLSLCEFVSECVHASVGLDVSMYVGMCWRRWPIHIHWIPAREYAGSQIPLYVFVHVCARATVMIAVLVAAGVIRSSRQSK